MSVLNKRKHVADKSSPRRCENNHTLEVLHNRMWGTPLANIFQNLVENCLRRHHSAQETSTTLAKTFRRMMVHNRTSRRFFGPGFKTSENLCKSVETSEKSLKLSENLWNLCKKKLAEVPGRTSRRFRPSLCEEKEILGARIKHVKIGHVKLDWARFRVCFRVHCQISCEHCRGSLRGNPVVRFTQKSSVRFWFLET